MTTPTREQVMQWAKESCGDMRLTGAVFFGSDELYIFVEKAIDDLESTIAEKDAEIRELRMSRKMREDTIAEQAAEIERLKNTCKDHGEIQYVLCKQLTAEQANVAELEAIEANLCDLHNVALEQVAAEQAKVKLLTEALETFMAQYPHMVKGYLLDAMDAVKEGK